MPARKSKAKDRGKGQAKLLFMVHMPVTAVLVGVPFVTDIQVADAWPVWAIYAVSLFFGWVAVRSTS